jgi:hypothetical protein
MSISMHPQWDMDMESVNSQDMNMDIDTNDKECPQLYSKKKKLVTKSMMPAIECDDRALIKLIHDNSGWSPHTEDTWDDEAFEFINRAAELNNKSLLEFLLKLYTYDNGDVPCYGLDGAVDGGHFELVKYIEYNHAKISGNREGIPGNKICDRIDMMQFFMDEDYIDSWEAVMEYACENGLFEMAKHFVNQGACCYEEHVETARNFGYDEMAIWLQLHLYVDSDDDV